MTASTATLWSESVSRSLQGASYVTRMNFVGVKQVTAVTNFGADERVSAGGIAISSMNPLPLAPIMGPGGGVSVGGAIEPVPRHTPELAQILLSLTMDLPLMMNRRITWAFFVL